MECFLAVQKSWDTTGVLRKITVTVARTDERTFVHAAFCDIARLRRRCRLGYVGDEDGCAVEGRDPDASANRRRELVRAGTGKCVEHPVGTEAFGRFEFLLFGKAEHDRATGGVCEGGDGLDDGHG